MTGKRSDASDAVCFPLIAYNITRQSCSQTLLASTLPLEIGTIWNTAFDPEGKSRRHKSRIVPYPALLQLPFSIITLVVLLALGFPFFIRELRMKTVITAIVCCTHIDAIPFTHQFTTL